MNRIPMTLFRCLPIWQQRQIVDDDFTSSPRIRSVPNRNRLPAARRLIEEMSLLRLLTMELSFDIRETFRGSIRLRVERAGAICRYFAPNV